MEIIKVYNITNSNHNRYNFNYSKETLGVIGKVLNSLIDFDYLEGSDTDIKLNNNLIKDFIKCLFKDYLSGVNYEQEYLKCLDGHRMLIAGKHLNSINFYMIALDYNTNYSYKLNYQVKAVLVSNYSLDQFKQIFLSEK